MPTGVYNRRAKFECRKGCDRKFTTPAGRSSHEKWSHAELESKPKTFDEPKPAKRQPANWTLTFVNGPTQIAVRVTDKLASRMIRLMMGD